jgi:hypothetical protein
MSEDKIRNLLQRADETAGEPAGVSAHLSVTIRRRAGHRRFAKRLALAAAAVVLLTGAGVWHFTTKDAGTKAEQERVAAIEVQIEQLQARTDATLSLIREVLDKEHSQSRLDKLEAELASIRDPLEEISREVDRTAFILVYQANRMYEHNQQASAVQAYRRVIELFPENRWAETARMRLSEITKRKTRKLDSKGDVL